MKNPFTILITSIVLGNMVTLSAVGYTISSVSTYNNIGIEVVFATAPASTATVSVAVKRTDCGCDYQPAHPLSRISETEFAGSVLDVEAGTEYSIRLTSAAFLSNEIINVFTRSETVPDATGTVYHVSPVFGNDGHSGLSSNQAFRTLGHALSLLQPGVQILLYDGRYYEGDFAIDDYQSGAPTAPIVIQNAQGAQPVLDGTDTNFAPSWVVFDTANAVYRTLSSRQPANAYINGEHLFHYLNLADLRTNRWSQPGGYYTDGSYFYARFPRGGPPGTNIVTIPKYSNVMQLMASYFQFRGLEICYYGYDTYHRGIYIHWGDSNLIENCYFHHNEIGVAFKRSANYNTVQGCRFLESPIASWSWQAVKQGDAGYEAGGICVYGSEEINEGNVIRSNVFANMFDGAHLYSENTEPPAPTKNMDYYDNLITNCGDDGIETDGLGVNNRIYRNRFIGFLTGISVAPAVMGPTYIFRNILAGWFTVEADYTYEGYPFKFNHAMGGTTQWVYIYHNTCFTDIPGQDGFLFKHTAEDGYWNNIVSRNNIYAGTDNALEAWDNVYDVDFDYDCLYTAHATKFINWGGTPYADIPSFFAATAHEHHGLSNAPCFVDSTAGNFALSQESELIDKGIVIPGVNNSYFHGAPDIGAYEFVPEPFLFSNCPALPGLFIIYYWGKFRVANRRDD